MVNSAGIARALIAFKNAFYKKFVVSKVSVIEENGNRAFMAGSH
jgi:hypothetical protein